VGHAIEEYKALMKKEVKIFKDKEVPIKVNVDDTKFLPEFTETEGVDSCMGGIVLHTRKGRIVCSNTLDDRLQLVYQESIPELRKLLFPTIKKQKEAKHTTHDPHSKHH